MSDAANVILFVIFLMNAAAETATDFWATAIDGDADVTLGSCGSSLLQAAASRTPTLGRDWNSGADLNLCIANSGGEEYLAPEFYLLGAEKSATSSFFDMVKHPGVVAGSNLNGTDLRIGLWPEAKELWIFNDAERFSYGRDWWLLHYPKCDRSKRLVAMDFTPVYISCPLAPQRIQHFYGSQNNRVKFGLILRDPLHRAHSAFHFYKDVITKASMYSTCGGPYCGECLHPSFQVYVLGVINAGSDPCALFHSKPTEEGYQGGGGDYAVQLQRYFKVFSPSQFTIFLFKNLTLGVMDLWARLGLEVSVLPPVIHNNGHSHVSLEEDLDNVTIAAIEEYINKKLGIDELVSTLIDGPQKPRLVGYLDNQEEDSAESVKDWIQAGW